MGFFGTVRKLVMTEALLRISIAKLRYFDYLNKCSFTRELP